MHAQPIDLTTPEFDPPDCPAWARESLPVAMLPFRGRNGLNQLPDRPCRTAPLALNVRGVDRYHANQFVVYLPQTADTLYQAYTPLTVNYRPGTLPAFETLAAEVSTGCRSETETAVALLTRGAARVRHPCGAPCGNPVTADRNLNDEALLASGNGRCNEQARVFIRLCQTLNIPARIIQLFYSDQKSGHCIAEFHADGRWCMADASWLCVFPGPDGQLLSAAECHDRGAGQLHCGRAYRQRMLQLLDLSDAELNFPSPQATANWRKQIAAENQSDAIRASKMDRFGIINYPLPPTVD